IGMIGKHVQKMRVHERLAADDAEKDVTHLLAFVNELVKSFRLDDFLLGSHVHPTTLATQVATIDDGNVEEWRGDIASFEPLLVFLDGARSLPAHVPGQFPQGPLVGLEQKTFGKSEVHPPVILSTR